MVQKICLLVDLAGSRSDSCKRQIGKWWKWLKNNFSEDHPVGFWYRCIKMKLIHVSLFLPSGMAQKILWPEIGAAQGRTHATEKLENHENDWKSWFLSTCGSWNWSRVLATRIFKDTWPVETVETDIKASVESNLILTPACCWPRFGGLKSVRPR